MISFVFPAFNEEENLKRFNTEVVPVFDALGEPYEIVIVDDGSRDGTYNTARSIRGPVRVVPHDKNRGLGAAVRTGIDEARGDLVITMDTDLTFAPSDVPLLLARFREGDVDVVSGSPKLAGFGEDIPSYRIFISSLATWAYRLVMGANVTAISPIFRLYRKSHLDQIVLRGTGFDINAEILFSLIRNGSRVAEVPTMLTQRIHGESKLNYRREMARHASLLLRMVRMRLFGTPL